MIFQPSVAFLTPGGDRAAPRLRQARVRVFLRALVTDAERARRLAEGVARRRGVEAAFLELLAPAARLLGEGWVEDSCDFATVTVALSRLQALMHALGRPWEAAADTPPTRRALICAAPGDQHGFGASMVAKFFRHAGWGVTELALPSRAELLGEVRRRRFDLIGLSLACEGGLAPLARLVEDLRAQSLAAGVPVLVGGPAFLSRPEAVRIVGADGAAADGPSAVALADRLTQRLRQAA